MKSNRTSCSRCVGLEKQCPYCNGKQIKHGVTKAGKMRLKCTCCDKTQVKSYTYKAYSFHVNPAIVELTKEGLDIRSTARFLRISPTTVIKRILSIASTIKLPAIQKGLTYEVDEIRTFIKRKDKLIWIVCALERESRQIVSFNTGSRTNKTLNVVLKTLKLSAAIKIYTDGLKNYKYLIGNTIHDTKRYSTNHIERLI